MTKISAFTGINRTFAPPLDKIPKLILIDRDGVINEDVGAPGVIKSSQLKLTPGAGVALGRLKRAGCKLALVTNQSCVGKGLLTEDELVRDIHGTLNHLLISEDFHAKLDHIFYCTSLRNSGDTRMKPNPGMIEEACDMFRVNPSDSIMIGDAVRDLQAAAAAGVPHRVLVESGYGKGVMNGRDAPVDGSLEIIDSEYVKNCKANNIAGTEHMDGSVLPFLYAKNLYCAVEWILH